MKNSISTIIILILIILLAISTLYGLKLGNFQILSISQLKQKNDDVNEKINQASTLTSIDYPNNIENLEATYEKYVIQKQKYEELSGFADKDSKDAYEKKQYDIGYLWRLLGKNATTRNLTLGIDVQGSSEGKENSYDLNFSVSGQYVNISQFITDIENNSDLFFRIYNFKMSGSGDTVSCTFTVKDINIDPSTITNTENTSLDFSD